MSDPFNVAGLSQFGQRRVNQNAFATDPWFGSDYMNDGDNGAYGYERFLGGLGGATPFQNFMRAKQGQRRNQYAAAQGSNPELKWTDWLLQNQDNFVKEYSDLGSSGRFQYGGANQRQPRMRWL